MARNNTSLLDSSNINELYAHLAADRPEPRTELTYGNSFTLLIAVLLSAQATDKSVNAASFGLFAKADNPYSMLALGEENIANHIRTIGLWRTKTRNILALCQQLIEQHDGKVPDQYQALIALPGVGRKTANVVLNEAFGQPSIAVDTHIFRIANRTGLAPGKTPEIVEDILIQITPKQYRQHAHHWLILHGRYVCTARKPKCHQCSIAHICRYPDKIPN